jgi:hypothetical protein
MERRVVMAKSPISSIIALYNSIDATHFGGDRPPIYLGSVPQVTAAGQQQRIPFVCIKDDGFRPDYDSSAGGVETGEVRLEVYAAKVDAVGEVTLDSIVRAIRFGGLPPGSKAGFDWGNFSFEVASHYYKVSLKFLSHRRDYAGFNFDGQRAHLAELRYECKAGLSAT